MNNNRQNVFISFDYDNDLQLKEGLIGQSRNDNSPFNVADFSMKEAAPESQWRKRARDRIGRCSAVIVMCGRHTDQAPGVTAEISIARELGKPYFLLRGYSKWTCVKPKGVLATDKMYNWTWKNLELLLAGRR